MAEVEDALPVSETTTIKSETDDSGEDQKAGYAADCSASDDQSSDDTATTPPNNKLSLNRFDVSQNNKQGGDDQDSSSSSDDNHVQHSSRNAASDEAENSNNNSLFNPLAKKPTPTSLEHRHETTKSSHHHHHHHSKHHRSARQNDDDDDNKFDPHSHSHNRSGTTLQYNNETAADSGWQLPPGGPLPQWNGVRLTGGALDPRLDLDLLAVNSSWPGGGNNETRPRSAAERESQGKSETEQTTQQPVPSLESYMQLVQICHPFYNDRRFLPTMMMSMTTDPSALENEDSIPAGSDDNTNVQSSEGFTSFFTTTHSSNNESSSENDKQLQQHTRHNNNKSLDGCLYKNHERPEKYDESTSGSNQSSREQRRVRIQEAQKDEDKTTSHQRQEGNNHVHPHRHQLHVQESSLSSESNNDINPAADNTAARRHVSEVPRVVTESSSSSGGNKSGMSTENNASSASNVGCSSISGNDKGSSEDKGTGSSEDAAAKIDTGDGEIDGSDEADLSGDKQLIGLGLEPGHHHESIDKKGLEQEDSEVEGATRERKLLDKKRKRIEMRREYEAQQQSESSENASIDRPDEMIRPGKPCTLEQVLQFSTIPRIVVQSNPPFLVVHTNAAYSRLTGIDSHNVVGKPIRALISMPTGNSSDTLWQADEAALTTQGTQGDVGSTQQVPRQHRKSFRLERLVASSGFGRIHNILIHAGSHPLIGKNVTIVQGESVGASGIGATDRDNAEAACCDQSNKYIMCRSSIAPIISGFVMDDSYTVSDKEESDLLKSKRRKHASDQDANSGRRHSGSGMNEGHHHHRKQRVARVTHYVMQLGANDDTLQGSVDSLSTSSTSIEARLLGLSKEKLRAHRLVSNFAAKPADRDVDMETEDEADATVQSESTEQTRLPLSAIG